MFSICQQLFYIFLNSLFFKDSNRSRRDLNPRAGFPTYTLSRGASSASWVLLHTCQRAWCIILMTFTLVKPYFLLFLHEFVYFLSFSPISAYYHLFKQLYIVFLLFLFFWNKPLLYEAAHLFYLNSILFSQNSYVWKNDSLLMILYRDQLL